MLLSRHAGASASAAKAKKIYGIVVPRDDWWIRAAEKVSNLMLRTLRYGFQGFVHPLTDIDAVVESAGLKITATASYWIWSVRLYTRGP